MLQHRNAVEYRQRMAILEGASRVPGIKPTDIVMASDADEIPNPEYLRQDIFEEDKLIVFNQRYFFYDFTCENRNGWPGTLAGPYSIFKDLNLNQMRKFKYRNRDDRVVYIPAEVSRESHAGWHCSSFGGVERIITKLESYAHQKYNQPQYKDREKIKDLMREKKDLIFRDDDRHQLFSNDQDNDEFLPVNWKMIYEDL
jgi:beta-1,4-mannosyl-glycoprotein beta-1,4-N-acetylglucosaminyltransferase